MAPPSTMHLQHAARAKGVEEIVELARELECRQDLRTYGGVAEHDAQRVSALGVADRERGIVGSDGAGADDHRVALGSQHVASRRVPPHR